jgi:hypothetical protein
MQGEGIDLQLCKCIYHLFLSLQDKRVMPWKNINEDSVGSSRYYTVVFDRERINNRYCQCIQMNPSKIKQNVQRWFWPIKDSSAPRYSWAMICHPLPHIFCADSRQWDHNSLSTHNTNHILWLFLGTCWVNHLSLDSERWPVRLLNASTRIWLHRQGFDGIAWKKCCRMRKMWIRQSW